MSAAAATPAKLPLSVRKQDRDTAAKRDEAVAEMSKVWGSPVKLEIDLPTMYAELDKANHREKDDVAKTANEEYAPALAKFLTEAMKDDGEDVKRELSRHWTTGVITLSIEQGAPEQRTPLSVISSGRGGLRIKNGNLDCFSGATGMFGGWPGTANYLKEFKVTELLEGGGSSEGTLPLREHRELKAALASEDYKQATTDFKALTGQELKWDGVADGQAVLKNDKVKDVLVRNTYGNVGFQPMEVVKCISAIVKGMKKNCEDEMIKEAFCEMFTGETIITFKWTPDCNDYDDVMKEKNAVTVYGNRVQLFQNKVLITQQASSPYRHSELDQIDFTPVF